jgi:hypothetical protein
MVVLRTAASAAPPKSMNCRPSPRLSLSSAATKCWLSEASGETSVRREQRQCCETEHLRTEANPGYVTAQPVERGPVLSFSPENKTPCQLGQTRHYSYASSPQLAPGQCPNGCLGHIQTQKHAHSTSQTNPTPRGAFVLKRRLASFSAENEPRDTDFTVALGP